MRKPAWPAARSPSTSTPRRSWCGAPIRSRVTDDLTLSQALDIAFEAETKASMYYDAFADFLDGPAKEFFVELARVEAEHAAEVAKRRPR